MFNGASEKAEGEMGNDQHSCLWLDQLHQSSRPGPSPFFSVPVFLHVRPT